MKNKTMYLFNFLLSIYVLTSLSFFYKQYLQVVSENQFMKLDFMFYVKDNYFFIGLFLLFLGTIMLNLIYLVEHWLFKSKEELRIKKLVGYNSLELVKDYSVKYMIMFLFTFTATAILITPILYYFKLPIVFPLILSFLFMFVVKLVLVYRLIKHYLNLHEYGHESNFSSKKIVAITIQFSLSLLLIFVSLHLFMDTTRKISPFMKLRNLNNAWALNLDTSSQPVEFWMEAERYPDRYLLETVSKLKQIYIDYEDNILVYYYGKHVGDTPTIFMNQESFELNGISQYITDDLLKTGKTPVILGSSYYSKYAIGDIFESEGVEYIVAQVFKANRDIDVVMPIGFAEDSTRFFNIVYLDNNAILKEIDMYNHNAYYGIYFFDINEHELVKLNAYLNEGDISYQYRSIKAIQEKHYISKMILLSSYFLVGSVNLLFSFIGLICIVFMDIQSKKVYFSILKLVGYTNKHIYLKYLSFLVFVFIPAYLIGFTLYVTTLGFTVLVASSVAALVIALLVLVSWISITVFKKINSVEIIGGENV